LILEEAIFIRIAKFAKFSFLNSKINFKPYMQWINMKNKIKYSSKNI
jgi:hypothetical protein